MVTSIIHPGSTSDGRLRTAPAMAPASTSNPWEVALERLRTVLDEHSFNNWFIHTRLESSEEGKIVVGAPSKFFAAWLRDHYLDQVEEVLRQTLAGFKQVSFRASSIPIAITEGGQAAAFETRAPKDPPPRQMDMLRLPPDCFVTGTGNRLAHAAVIQAIDTPGSALLQQVLVHGPSSVGKSCLLEVAEQLIGSRYPKHRMVSCTGEDFTNDFVAHNGKKQMPAFRQKYREANFLLMDGVGYIAGKEGTMEEFGLTLDALRKNGAQVILAMSEDPHKMIPGLWHDVRTRLAGGLVVEMTLPSDELRREAFRSMAARQHLPLTPELLEAVVDNSEHFRDLTGALASLALLHYKHIRVTTEIIEEVFSKKPKRTPTADSVFRAVASVCFFRDPKGGVRRLRSGKRDRDLSQPRFLVMYLLHEYFPDLKLESIADALGLKDHTSVIYGLKQISEKLRKGDAELRLLIERIRQEIEEI